MILFIEALLVGQVFSQDACERLTEDDRPGVFSFTGLVAAAISPVGDGGPVASVHLIPGSMQIVCEAQHEMQDRYRYTSALFSYVCQTTGSIPQNCDGRNITAQLTLSCASGTWSRIIFNNAMSALTLDPSATASTLLASNCSFCIPPSTVAGLTTSMVTHCVGKSHPVSESLYELFNSM